MDNRKVKLKIYPVGEIYGGTVDLGKGIILRVGEEEEEIIKKYAEDAEVSIKELKFKLYDGTLASNFIKEQEPLTDEERMIQNNKTLGSLFYDEDIKENGFISKLFKELYDGFEKVVREHNFKVRYTVAQPYGIQIKYKGETEKFNDDMNQVLNKLKNEPIINEYAYRELDEYRYKKYVGRVNSYINHYIKNNGPEMYGNFCAYLESIVRYLASKEVRLRLNNKPCDSFENLKERNATLLVAFME